MNLPQKGCCCCTNCCRSSSSPNTNDYSGANLFVNSPRHEHIYALHPSRRKRLSSFSTLRKTTERNSLNLIFILSTILLSFANVGNCSEVPINLNNYVNGESTSVPSSIPDSSSYPTASSSSLNNVIVPGPSTSTTTSNSPSVTQSYFINGYANQIQKTNVTDLRAFAGNRPFQLQFRTVCPFGNIVNDDKFALRFNSEGFLTYLVLPQEVQSLKTTKSVVDGKWHSVTFIGPHVILDDRSLTDPGENETNRMSIQWFNSNDTVDHRLSFFDGFVGCIRLHVPANNTPSSSSDPSQMFLSQSYNTQADDLSVIVKLFSLKGLQKYQPCEDLEFDLGSVQCFDPDNFVLCSKCENNATCVFADRKNECECPEPADESVTYNPPFCSRDEPAHVGFSEVVPESRELHSMGGDFSEPFVASTTGSSRSSFVPQSSALMSSTTEHVAAPSSVEQRVLPQTCPCKHGGTCLSSPEDWKICDCSGTGYTGRLCNNDVCDENPGICGNFGKCFDEPSRELGYECYCKPGYAGDLCDINFDECLSAPCVNNGTCFDGVNTYTCECQLGFNGKNCQINIDECDPNPCNNGGTCVDLVANYSCECVVGFIGNDCEIDINECESTPCQNNGKCQDLTNDYSCTCDDTGFFGRNCENNVDDCDPMPCQNGGTCTDGVKEHTCSCYPGFDGTECERDIPECDALPCKHGSCYQKSIEDNYFRPSFHNLTYNISTAEGYICECEEGYTGTNCEINIDECQLTFSPCSGHGKCTDGVNEFSCECDKGFEGPNCEIDINECEPYPCDHARDCKNLAGDFECECNHGYGGKRCDVALTGCISNFCLNDGSCTAAYDEATNNHTFSCKCKQGYLGVTCETKTTMGFGGSSLAIVVKYDEAFTNNKYYLTFQFRTTLRDVVLAAGQGGTYFYLGLSDAKLNLRTSLINSLQGMTSGSGLADGKWHRVIVSINSTHAILSAGIEQVTLPIITETEDVLPTSFFKTVLGSPTSDLSFLNKNELVPFVGCMQDVQINDDYVLPSAEENSNVTLTNIVSSCIRKDQCNPNPCENRGVCTDLWKNFTCTCPRPHLGDRCQFSYNPATFNHENSQNSLVTVDTPASRFAGVFDISMFVRTRMGRGTLFLLCDKERGLNSTFIEASVTKSGNLVVHAKWSGTADDDGGKTETYTVDGIISDGIAHLISVQKDKTFIVIKVDEIEHFRKTHTNKIFNPTVMYIGGKPKSLSGTDPSITTSGPEGHSGETSTSLPDTPIDNNTEGTAADAEGTEIFVPEEFRFKGTIQDVRVNKTPSEQSQSSLGLTSHSKTQNVYVVEFFELGKIGQDKYPSLGQVVIQNVLNGSVSDDHCSSSPCMRGECQTTWNDFKCNCYEGFDGKQCDTRLRCADVACPDRSICVNIGHTGFECVIDASFDGKGYATPHYILLSNNSTDVTFSELSFKYRSNRPNTNLIHMSNGSAFIRVSLERDEESSIVFHFTNNEKLVITSPLIFDGEWHSVGVQFTTPNSGEDSVVLTFDKNPNITRQSAGFLYHSNQYLKDLILSPNLDIVIGSSLAVDDYGKPLINDPHQSHNQYYRGCLRDIFIGKYRLPFIPQSSLEEANINISNRTLIDTTAPTAFYINEKFYPSEQHLPRLGCTLCYEKDCRNGGRCTDPLQSFECTCEAGYEGNTCDVDIDECVNNMCTHGSTCIDSINNYTCACVKGYDGWLCDNEINECEEGDEEKCQHNGQCVDGIGEFTCQCTDDYTGIFCEKRKESTCADFPCKNKATCREVSLQPNGVFFTCHCAPGWEGELCSMPINYCETVECQNGGTCINKQLGAQCACSDGFNGLYCDNNIDECASNPCKNNGKCIDDINKFKCICDDTGFNGMLCDIDVDECSELEQLCPRMQICENIIGNYTCSCPDKSMCGFDCDISNPCFGFENFTCYNGGTCSAHCDNSEQPEPICLCMPGYSGSTCQELILKRPAGEGSVDILLIIIPVLAAMLIAATIGIIILVRMARRKRATRGVYSPSQQEYCNPRVELDNVMKPPPEERLI